jgi:type IV pilus assembly protein PilW
MNGGTRMTLQSRQAGFSIIELMISIALGLVILAALTGFFVSTSGNRHEMERATRQIENGRYAIDTLRDDVVMAGFFADLAPGVTPTWQTNAACPADLASLGFAISPAYTAPVPIFGYADGAGAPTGCLPNMVPGTDVLVVRRFQSESVPLATAQAATPADRPNNLQWYVQISECAADDPNIPFKVDVGSSSNFNLHKLDCSAIADLWRLREQVYYLRDYSTTAGDGIPTLVRAELHVSASQNMETLPLVEGIESFRVDYGIDNSNDGTPDVWSRCDTTTPCTATDWSNVTAAKVYVLSRNLEKTNGWVDNKTYSMGLSGTLPAFGDAYKRHVYSAQVNLPNRSGPREPQYITPP